MTCPVPPPPLSPRTRHGDKDTRGRHMAEGRGTSRYLVIWLNVRNVAIATIAFLCIICTPTPTNSSTFPPLAPLGATSHNMDPHRWSFPRTTGCIPLECLSPSAGMPLRPEEHFPALSWRDLNAHRKGRPGQAQQGRGPEAGDAAACRRRAHAHHQALRGCPPPLHLLQLLLPLPWNEAPK
jgi:hypothetical protein